MFQTTSLLSKVISNSHFHHKMGRFTEPLRGVRWFEKSCSQGEGRNTHCPCRWDDVVADRLKRNYRELFMPMNVMLAGKIWGEITEGLLQLVHWKPVVIVHQQLKREKMSPGCMFFSGFPIQGIKPCIFILSMWVLPQ